MYECHIKAFGETFDCKDKAQCLEMMVSSKVGFGFVTRSDIITESRSNFHLLISFDKVCFLQGTFHCQDGTCIEMLDFTCERRCKVMSNIIQVCH